MLHFIAQDQLQIFFSLEWYQMFIKRLPISPKGFPVPWFVAWIDGVPDFRVVRKGGIPDAHNKHLCWVCGEALGRTFAMTLGPMCVINRTISEPPAHRDCAVYSATACPFLSNPRMRRNAVGIPTGIVAAPGHGISRNPGAVAVWLTRGYRPFRTPDGGVLFTFDDPTEVLWYAEGRTATRAEVEASITSGIHLLEAEAEREGTEAVAALTRARAAAMTYLPAA